MGMKEGFWDPQALVLKVKSATKKLCLLGTERFSFWRFHRNIIFDKLIVYNPVLL